MFGKNFLPLFIGLAFWCGIQANAQPPDPVAQTLRDWEARSQKLRSVRYTLSGTCESLGQLPKGYQYPPGSRIRPLKAMVLIDFDKKRIRVETNQEALVDGAWAPHIITETYDGKKYQSAMPRESGYLGPEDPDINIVKGSRSHSMDIFLWPVFAAHGIVPTVNEPLLIDRLPFKHDPDQFEAIGTVTHEGRRCLVIKTEPLNSVPALTDEIWVDPERASAVVRHIHFSGKNPAARLEVSHQESPHGWVPRAWSMTWSAGGKVERIQRLTVDSMEANPAISDGDFAVSIKPGALISARENPEPGKGLDPRRPAETTYRVDEDGKWIKLQEKGFTTMDGVQLPPEKHGWRWYCGQVRSL